jgi:phosphate-selective porin OprO/OprP
MKTLSYTLCAILAAGFAFTGDAQVKPKSKKATELKFSGRIQGQWDGIESDKANEDRNHFYFRRLFLGGHAKAGDNWGGDIVLDFAASPNSENKSYTDQNGKSLKTSVDQVFIDGASVWYKYSDAFRVDLGQKKVPFGLEETTSSSKLKAIERSAVNRQFAERLKFNARHTGLFAKGALSDQFSYDLAVVNSGQNHNSKDGSLKGGKYGYDNNELAYYGRLTYSNYESDLRHILGVAVGQMEADPDDADNITAYNIFGSVGSGPFNLEAEYMMADIKGTDDEHKGYSVQLSYALSNAPAGAWELLYRYSTVEATGSNELISAKEIIRRANISSDFQNVNELNQNYIGVNYLFNGHDAKLMMGYEFNEAVDETIGKRGFHGPRARVQFLF